MDLVHKRPANIFLAIGEEELILKGEVDIGLQPATITLITQGELVILLNVSEDISGGDDRVGYKSKTRHYYS